MQHDYEITRADANTGITFRAAVNAALQAQATNNSGATEPVTPYAFMWWADSANDLLRIRNATNTAWIVVGTLSAAGFGIGAGDVNVAGSIHVAPEKTTPVDADEMAVIDSAAGNALKKTLWANIKATLRSHFDTVYTLVNLGGVPTSRTVNSKALSADIVLTTADVADSTDKRYCTDAQKTVIGNTSGTNTGDQTLSGLGGVPTSRTVNSKALSADIVLTTADMADSTDKRYCTDAQKTVIGNTSGTNTGDQTLSGLGGVPTSRTVNSKALSADIVLTTADIVDSTDKRYCTDAQITVIGNTSGTNTGDQTLSGLGGIAHALATAANDFLVASGAGAFVKKTLAETLTILGKGSASGLATLNSSSLVVENPANATATPTASKIPITNGSGVLADGWATKENVTGLKSTDSPAFVTAKLSGLSDTRIPKHTSDAAGLADSLLYEANSAIGVGVSPASRNNTSLQTKDGIGFPASQVASSDVNTLDDYEEGTWTPTFNVSGAEWSTSPTVHTAQYVKIGKMVIVQIGAYGGVCETADKIGGLPFAATSYSVAVVHCASDCAVRGGGNTDSGAAEIRYLSAMDMSPSQYWALTCTYFAS